MTDEGHTYTGKGQIRDWLARSATEYTYTTALVAASKVDAGTTTPCTIWRATFPAASSTLHFRFSLSAGKITSLVIEP